MMQKPRDDLDTAWKEILERYFPDFTAFFFPAIFGEIDWHHGFEFLDKELQYAVRQAGRGRRTVDKLARVWRRDGSEAWVLVHVEVQSQVEAGFSRRMFACNALLSIRFKCAVVSLGVLGDTQRDWRPASYEQNLLGCRVRMEFPIVKLLDYERRSDELEGSANPFAAVVLAHLKSRATRRSPRTRLQWKVQILRWLYDHGYSENQFIDLFRFLELVMPLPGELDEAFKEEIEQCEEVRKVEWISHYEKKAIERGLQQGLLEATREDVVEALRLRFKRRPQSLMKRLEELKDPALLKKLHRKAITAVSLEEFERALPPAPVSH